MLRGRKHGPMSEEQKKKVSISHMGIRPSEETRKKLSESHRGHTITEETRKRMLEAQQNRNYSPEYRLQRAERMRGDKNYFWEGGKTVEIYSIEFSNELRGQVRKRDNRKCQCCFKHQDELKNKLDVHHVDYNKKNNNQNNLISLCRVCHAKTNSKRPEWTAYFQRILGTYLISEEAA